MAFTASDAVPLTRRERIHLLLLDDVKKSLADIEAGRTRDAREALADLKRAAERSSAGARTR